ncbi:MAG: SlyX family protein [Rhizobiales bacterium]|nr:SlyX family protein [Hyphomicrobiales bacterium]
MTSVEQRIEDLEMRIAYQDKTIADLNDVITAQWKKIEKLERQLQRLDEEVQSLDSRDAPPVTRPPHY